MSQKKVKILFLGSRCLAEKILQFILENSECEVIAIVLPNFKGWWEDNLKNIAINKNIQIYDNIEETNSVLYDLVLSINYWKKIPTEVINKVNGNIVNLHHSYRLKYKGRYSTSWAIMNARKDNCWEHGTTLHYIDHTLDNGRIIATDKVEITEDDTAETLFVKVELLAFSLFKDTFHEILKGSNKNIDPSPSTYTYDRYSKDNITLPDPIELIYLYDFVRAWTFKNRPLPHIKLQNGKKIILKLE